MGDIACTVKVIARDNYCIFVKISDNESEYIYIYMSVCVSILSRTDSTEFPSSLSLSLSLSLALSLSLSLSLYVYIYLYISVPILHLFWQVASCVNTELMQVNLCWSANTDVSICNSPLENVAYEFVLISLTVLTSISCTFYLIGL